MRAASGKASLKGKIRYSARAEAAANACPETLSILFNTSNVCPALLSALSACSSSSVTLRGGICDINDQIAILQSAADRIHHALVE